MIESDDHLALIDYEELGLSAAPAIPIPDNYWPFMYVLALKENCEEPRFPAEGIAHGSASMWAVLLGA